MGILAEDVARVRASTDIVAVIGQHTEIKRSGRRWMARCPLHGERTPSMSVSPEKGVYYCFGCQRSGDVITFVQEIEGLDFTGAVESLAGRAGIRLRYTGVDESGARTRRRRLLEAVAKARDFYHRRMLSGAGAGPARNYLRSRGYDGDLVRRWQIGWAPDGWDTLARHLRLTDGDLRDSGLGYVNTRGRQQDFFRARVMFPVSNERGDPVGFGGRVLPGADGPKYMNTSTDARVYDKSKVLYGLHEHRKQIVRAGQAVVCEGYTDVIGCAEAGIDRAVATCGTALTEEHVRLLKRFSAGRLVLAFDADAAGLDAAGRVYEWESKFEVEVRVADLPPGQDPGELARSNPEALRRAVEEAVPFLEFRVNRVLDAADMSTIESRARAAERSADVVRMHPDPMVRDPHLVRISDRCRADVGHLRQYAQRAPGPPGGFGSSGGPGVSGGPGPSDWFGARGGAGAHGDMPRHVAGDSEPGRGREPRMTRLTPEDEALRMAIHAPEAVGDTLHASLFGDPVRREAFEALAAAGSVAAASQSVSDAAARLLHRLAVDSGDADVDDVLAGLARLSASRAMQDLRRMAATGGDPTLQRQCIESIAWLKSQSERLGERNTRDEILTDLLAWLVEHARHNS